MSNNNSPLLQQAVLDADVILESPAKEEKIKIRIVTGKFKKYSLETFYALKLNGPVYDVNTIENYPFNQFLKSVKKHKSVYFNAEKNLKSNFAKVHIYRAITQILDLHNCSYKYKNVRVIGIYKYGQMYSSSKNNCHFLEEFKTGRKIEINLNLVEFHPSTNSTYVLFGSIVYQQPYAEKNEIVPHILVHFFQDLPCSEKYETLFYTQKKFWPEDFDFITQFDLTCDQSTLETIELNEVTNNTMFDDFDASLLIDKVESDEKLYFEIERLMNINISD